jgi:peptidoglycan/xylan/chitin deacetylase (PgdA/CDA1 family)
MTGFKTLLASAVLAGIASSHPQPQVGKRQATTVPYGVAITSCTVPGTVALTFDDGPYIYTEGLLDTLEAAGHRVTFFQNGLNWDSIYNYNSTLQRMIAGNHQVCSHTWSHADLTTLSTAEATLEMTELEVAFQAIIGMIPTYMRPVSTFEQCLLINLMVEIAIYLL